MRAIEQVMSGQNLSLDEARDVFGRVIKGELSDAEMTDLLLGLKTKKETPDEIAGAALAMRGQALPIDRPKGLLADCVGTGGDGVGTVNISTAVMVIAASCGLSVAKHGNTAVSSQCGSADLLKRGGVRIDMAPKVARDCLDQVGFTFLYAPVYHSGTRYAMGVRKALKTRTIFNLLGPLCNPLHPDVLLVGVYDPSWCLPVAQTLRLLGARRGLVVHGSGLDEIALHGPTSAVLLEEDTCTPMTLSPKLAGLPTFELNALVGGDPDCNWARFSSLLQGKGDAAYAAAAALNAGALLWVAQKAESLAEGADMAKDALNRGDLLDRFSAFAQLSQHD